MRITYLWVNVECTMVPGILGRRLLRFSLNLIVSGGYVKNVTPN